MRRKEHICCCCAVSDSATRNLEKHSADLSASKLIDYCDYLWLNTWREQSTGGSSIVAFQRLSECSNGLLGIEGGGGASVSRHDQTRDRQQSKQLSVRAHI